MKKKTIKTASYQSNEAKRTFEFKCRLYGVTPEIVGAGRGETAAGCTGYEILKASIPEEVIENYFKKDNELWVKYKNGKSHRVGSMYPEGFRALWERIPSQEKENAYEVEKRLGNIFNGL